MLEFAVCMVTAELHGRKSSFIIRTEIQLITEFSGGAAELIHRWLYARINEAIDNIKLTTLSRYSECFSIVQNM